MNIVPKTFFNLCKFFFLSFGQILPETKKLLGLGKNTDCDSRFLDKIFLFFYSSGKKQGKEAKDYQVQTFWIKSKYHHKKSTTEFIKIHRDIFNLIPQ